MNDMTPPAMGHNTPPPYDPDVLAKHIRAASELAAEAAPWLKKGKVESEDEAQKLNDVIAKARKLYRDAEESRKAEKEPHIEAGKAVDEAFRIATTATEKTGNSLKPIIATWLKKVEEDKKAEAARQAEIARKAKEDAERLAAQAEASNDAFAAAQAEAAQKAASKLEKGAIKASKAKASVTSATGGGRSMSLRKRKVAVIDNINLVFRHFSDHPDVREVLQRLANAAVVRGETVPGATPDEIESAA